MGQTDGVTDLLVPGDHRADGVLDDAAVLAAMLRVEEVWLAALVVHDVAPAAAALPAGALARLVGAPLLLSESGRLSPVVAGDVAARRATVAYLVGGTGSLGARVVSDLRSLGVTRVVRVAGSRAEHDIPFAGLHALLGPFATEAHLATLPAVQRDGLLVALGLGNGSPPGPLVVGAATLGLLAAVDSLLVLVDDLRRRIQRGDHLVLHCGAGIGRAGTIAAALLMRAGLSHDEAVARVVGGELRPGHEGVARVAAQDPVLDVVEAHA